MRILQLNFERGWRGGERQTLLTLRQHMLAGHQVELLARKGGELARRAAELDLMVHECENVWAVCRFLLSRRRQYDVMHAQTANMMSWLAFLRPWLKTRIVFTRRTAFPLRKNEARNAWKWRQADALVAISDAAAAEPRRLGLKVVVIPSAVEARPLNSAHLQAFARQHQLDGKRVLATAAALTEEKDPLTLIDAIHALSRERQDFVFLHLGAGGNQEEAARQRVRELGLESVYCFAGFQEGVENLYRLMDVFVLSSRYEALGSSVLDAFLYGVPVVATNAGGLAEVLADGRGLSSEVGDAPALAANMARVLDDPVLRATMAERAGRYVASEHDPAAMAGRYLELYHGRQGLEA
ncbi:MAG: glycosyltransferase family 4 protein [Alcaligenaceae bacterium]|nr:glycosyltransferase family 4 protein [Alcaligenaceae bacterium]